MSQSRLTSGEANKRKTRKRENSPKPPTHEKPDKPNQTKTRPRQQTKPKPRRRGSQKHQPGQRTTRQADKTNQSEGAGGRRQAETSKQGKSGRPGRQQRQEGGSSSSIKTIMRLFTCGQAHNEACKCTADQNLNVAKVKTNLGEGGGEGGVHLSSLRTDAPRNRTIQQSETNREKRETKRVHCESKLKGRGKTKSCGE